MAKLVKNVRAGGVWYGPAYPNAGDPPAGAITNPACWEDGQVPSSQTAERPAPAKPEPSLNPAPATPTPPPRSGKGSTDEAWTVYARSQGVAVTESVSRREVIEACEKAGVPT